MASKEDEKKVDAKDQAQDAGEAAEAPSPVSALGEAAAFATSANAATGEVVEIPKDPEAIAQRATELGLAGDHATGGFANVDPDRNAGGPKFQRVWGMDADQTAANRDRVDQFKPDCSVQL